VKVELERDDKQETFLDSAEYQEEEPAVELDINKFKQEVQQNFAKIQVHEGTKLGD
jgi:hypothetical protein